MNPIQKGLYSQCLKEGAKYLKLKILLRFFVILELSGFVLLFNHLGGIQASLSLRLEIGNHLVSSVEEECLKDDTTLALIGVRD